MDRVDINGNFINREMLLEYKSLMINRQLPSQNGKPDGAFRNGIRVINNYLVDREYAKAARGNKRGVLKEGIDLDSVFSSFPVLIELSEENETIEEIDEFGTEINNLAYIYFIVASNGKVKIGKTNNLNRRLQTLSTMSPIELKLLYSITVDRKKVTKFEGYFHRLFECKRNHGEWFNLSYKDIEIVKEWEAMRQGTYVKDEWWHFLISDRSQAIIKNILIIAWVVAIHRAIFRMIAALVELGGL